MIVPTICSSIRKKYTLSGIRMRPVPKKGILSTNEIRKAYFMGLCKPKTINPMDNSKKVSKKSFNPTDKNLFTTTEAFIRAL